MGTGQSKLISPTQDELTLLYYRLNRFVTASIVGAVLSCTALTLQTVTRNYLVDSGTRGKFRCSTWKGTLNVLKVGQAVVCASWKHDRTDATFTLEVWVE